MKYFKKLVGERIYLSPRNSEDVEQFTEWLNDFNTTDYIGRSGASVTLDTEKEYLSRVSKDTATFVIVTLEDNKMIGTSEVLKYCKIIDADIIYVIKNGEVFDHGTHEYLMKNCEFYQNLYTTEDKAIK